MTTNRNHIPPCELTRAELDAWSERSNAQVLEDIAVRKRLAEWPGAIEQALFLLLARIERLEEQLAAKPA